MKHILALLACAIFLLTAPPTPATASQATQSEGAQFEALAEDFLFGGELILRAQIRAGQPIRQVNIFFRPATQPDTRLAQADLTPEGLASYTLDLDGAFLPAFAEISYWFEVILEDGSSSTSPVYTFRYDDNRFDWQDLEQLPLRVHWYQDGLELGQYLSDVAEQGLEKINRLIAIYPEEPIDAYIYDNSLDMQSTLLLGNLNWVAGHADPELGVVVLSLPPGPEQRVLARQRLPHELMHVMLYRKMGTGYTNLPTWLSEGLASLAELENNPDYVTILEKANEKGLSIPLAALCDTFPQDASNAFLAYAQSEWFTRYLYEQYGADKMSELVAAYADGLACERAPEVVLGRSLSELEQEWRQQQFGQAPLLTNWQDVLPWLLLVLIALTAPILMIIIQPRRRSKHGE